MAKESILAKAQKSDNLETLRDSYKLRSMLIGDSKSGKTTLNEVFNNSEFKVFKEAVDAKGIVTGLVAAGCASFSRNQIDGLTNFVKNLGAKGMVWFKVQEKGIDSPTAKFLSNAEKENLVSALKAKPNDLILILAGERNSNHIIKWVH